MPQPLSQIDPPPPPPTQLPYSNRSGPSSPQHAGLPPPNQTFGIPPAPSSPLQSSLGHERTFSQDPAVSNLHHNMGHTQSRDRGDTLPSSSNGPPQLSALPFQQAQRAQSPSQPTHPPAQQQTPLELLPPINPVFGRTLEELFERDKFPVPEIVSRCIQAVDLFGLEVEGIYRLSGSAAHIQHMKAIFDNGSSLQYPAFRSVN